MLQTSVRWESSYHDVYVYSLSVSSLSRALSLLSLFLSVFFCFFLSLLPPPLARPLRFSLSLSRARARARARSLFLALSRSLSLSLFHKVGAMPSECTKCEGY